MEVGVGVGVAVRMGVGMAQRTGMRKANEWEATYL